ncbi:MAG: preprotein translocase subunit SecE [Candidatus Nanopelagicales bacterium]
MSDTVAERPKGGGADERPGFGTRVALFYRQVVAELRKVIWPTRRELITYTWVVIVFVTIIATIVGIFDYGFGRLVLAVFGS